MIVSAAVCPHPPMMLTGLTGLADVAAALRAWCLSAVEALLAEQPERVVVVGGDSSTRLHCDGTTAGASPFGGLPGSGGARLPLSLGVGRSLLDAAAWSGPAVLQGISSAASSSSCASLGAELASSSERTALLVMGDGSARRTVRAPGYVDDRALPFDAVATQALQDGDPGALAALDPALAADLLVQGRAAWQVLAGALEGTPVDARLLHAEDPFGVLYLVATWLPR